MLVAGGWGAPDGAAGAGVEIGIEGHLTARWLVAGGGFLVPSYKLLATSYLHTRRPMSSGVCQPTIGRPFYGQAKDQL